MSSTGSFTKEIKIRETSAEDISSLIAEHMESLAFPLDSWLEDNLTSSVKYKLLMNNTCIGYAAITGDTLHFFYVEKDHFRYASPLFERIIEEKQIKRVSVFTQDPLLAALIAEWDYEKEKAACFFTDAKTILIRDTDSGKVLFKTAAALDAQRIREIAGDFFDEPSGGFDTLGERIEAETIFLLEEEGCLLGIGIVEKSLYCGNITSIGMFTNKKYRKRNVAKTILLNLKKWAYENNLQPVAGCWYYNTLSRKSLESAGMIVTAIGYDALLKGKEKLPLWTGNPPGEPVQ